MEQAQALHKWFVERGCAAADVDVLQPADPFLETAGEDLRRRIFITSNGVGDMLCLRPEFTIPTCLHHIKHSIQTPCRYSYVGTVFRQHRNGKNEFLQVGIEDLGNHDASKADVQSLSDAHAALAKLGVDNHHTVLGDRTLFASLVSAIGLPKGWQVRLLRCFGEADQMQAALDKLKQNGVIASANEMPEWVVAGDLDLAEAEVSKLMSIANLPEQGGRTAREIAARAIEKAELDATRLEGDALAALEKFLEIDVPVKDAVAALTAFETDTHIDLGQARADFAKRYKLLAQADFDLSTISYRASFGRRLDYYTGLFFEIYQDNDAQNSIVGGGRYDHLLSMLGAEVDIPAIGFSIDFDRIKAKIGKGAKS